MVSTYTILILLGSLMAQYIIVIVNSADYNPIESLARSLLNFTNSPTNVLSTPGELLFQSPLKILQTPSETINRVINGSLSFTGKKNSPINSDDEENNNNKSSEDNDNIRSSNQGSNSYYDEGSNNNNNNVISNGAKVVNGALKVLPLVAAGAEAASGVAEATSGANSITNSLTNTFNGNNLINAVTGSNKNNNNNYDNNNNNNNNNNEKSFGLLDKLPLIALESGHKGGYYDQDRFLVDQEDAAIRNRKYFSRDCEFRISCELGRQFRTFSNKQMNDVIKTNKIIYNLQNRYTKAMTYGFLHDKCTPYYCLLLQFFGGPKQVAGGMVELLNRVANPEMYEDL